ncbi:hypothetical protein AOXY_G28076 [Acipenser oxyrinchus oxyrinchus]|uniref:Uncharacterized protein n=1 Tax=Acipenser oxyrinchus oxyrinchus TaxID=40147 RepID=A0AAD8CPY6_ACIOX|nr:hypothetical protein AOXY_G28076 [Acipenser oxyrinchus oxyrinchus]
MLLASAGAPLVSYHRVTPLAPAGHRLLYSSVLFPADTFKDGRVGFPELLKDYKHMTGTGRRNFWSILIG